VPGFNGTEREWGKGRGRETKRRGKGKVEGITEGRGGRKAWGIRMGGIAPLLLRRDRRHCRWFIWMTTISQVTVLSL